IQDRAGRDTPANKLGDSSQVDRGKQVLADRAHQGGVPLLHVGQGRKPVRSRGSDRHWNSSRAPCSCRAAIGSWLVTLSNALSVVMNRSSNFAIRVANAAWVAAVSKSWAASTVRRTRKSAGLPAASLDNHPLASGQSDNWSGVTAGRPTASRKASSSFWHKSCMRI